jgi:hypothetical protein
MLASVGFVAVTGMEFIKGTAFTAVNDRRQATAFCPDRDSAKRLPRNRAVFFAQWILRGSRIISKSLNSQ